MLFKKKYQDLYDTADTECSRISKKQKNGDIPVHMAATEMFTVMAQKNMYFDFLSDLDDLELDNKKTQKS
ncbi:hypothetical protein [Companilactobacillus nodensis]|uniref:Uncharacterized protein n=1 Tax=Companilactobacillus nodensis DSM 19682 = JCM 14932 = NBRC 107160 TaxID=1423775 RepID=A0A0R1K5E4_9LACO|nr:hypothetical protein [Companilactobacillus nodensis]KRK78741.1 hypothetical protein FD03_GL002518 [Companilactobacillus nodensis DSM 19682 = JCM 14932 = NBRC 107160]